MAHADSTSRAPVEEAEDTMNEIINNSLEVLLVGSGEDEVATIQHSDTKWAELMSILKIPQSDRTKLQVSIH